MEPNDGAYTATSSAAAPRVRFCLFISDGPNSEHAASFAVSAISGLRETIAATIALP